MSAEPGRIDDHQARTDRQVLETELASLIERDKPKERFAEVRAAIDQLPPDESDVVETAAVAAPENTMRPAPKAKPAPAVAKAKQAAKKPAAATKK